MNIGIYYESSEMGFFACGVERSVVVLAEALKSNHHVDIVHHNSSLTEGQLEAFYGVKLDGVRLSYHKFEVDRNSSRNPIRRYHEARNYCHYLSKPYDLFVSFGTYLPPFCHARKGALMILFPEQFPPYIQAGETSHCGSFLWEYSKRLYYKWETRKRLATYQVKTANSSFVREWTKHRWGVDTRVVFAPVDTKFRVVPKANMILSVGRFASSKFSKAQLEMVTAFSQIAPALRDGWEYFCVGSLSQSPPDIGYYDKVRAVGNGCGVNILTNLAWKELAHLYGQAKIFFHGAGIAVNQQLHPEHCEHFGMTTVEAMAAGCVPIVINKGGQPEIVEHGINGFVWNTLGELKEYTILLMHDEQLREKMSQAARMRANLFSTEEYVTRFIQVCRSAGIELAQ